MTVLAARRGQAREVPPVLAFLGRRLVGAILALFIASVLIFAATSVLPGDAASVVLGRGATPEAVRQLDRELHLDRPLLQQYGSWLGGFVHGDLGDSSVGLAQGQKHAPVWRLISEPVRNSLILALVTAFFMLPLSLILGAVAAVFAGRLHAEGIGDGVIQAKARLRVVHHVAIGRGRIEELADLVASEHLPAI